MNMSNKSTNPKGTKDYGPSELLSVRFIINKIRNVFISFGYSEIETPSIEKRATVELKPVLKRPDGMVQQAETVHVSNVY